MDHIPSATEIETLRKYLADIKIKNRDVLDWRSEYDLPEVDAVMHAFKRLIAYRIDLKHSGQLNDDVDYNHLSGLPIEKIKMYIIDHPEMIDRLVNDYEAKTKVAAREKLFSTKLGEMTGYQFREYLVALGLKVNDLEIK